MGTRRALLAAVTVALAGCGRDEILHGLDEGQANQAVVALGEAGISAATRRDEGADGSWRVDVPAGDAASAQRILAERGLPRRPPPGFGEIFGKGSMVPTPGEERALYLHALSGELGRTIEAIDGVVEARVHLAVASQEPFRAEPAPPARASVLVKTRAGARTRVEALAPGIQSLVAGAVAGLDGSNVAVVIAESSSAGEAQRSRRGQRTWLLAGALLAGMAAIAVPGWLVWDRLAPGVRRLVARGERQDRQP